ncbi:hypothetical protein TSUD_360480 [Trifolium subterraneum]|uniref:Uncharacterized protein n=1 Tax=Trifolium subterraneum TaxID=3900 RepID=A0A2Z6MJE4_TRISU|nr:hypothetical protein TSUD_360480 [Trifolium subterraneum]
MGGCVNLMLLILISLHPPSSIRASSKESKKRSLEERPRRMIQGVGSHNQTILNRSIKIR